MHKKIKKIQSICCLVLSSFLSTLVYADAWNGGGSPETALSLIKSYYVYPTYAVVIQGPVTGGPANCMNNDRWEIVWGDFDAPTQARLHASILTSQVMNKPIAVGISSNGCGPEGYKKTNGQIYLPQK